MAATTESFSPMTDSLFLTALVLASMYGYHALWTKVTSLSLFAPQVKPSEASRGRIWCFAWSAVFFLLSSYWPVAKLLGIKTPGEGEYEDFLVTVLGGGKSLLAHLGNNVLVLRSIYLAVMPSCLEGSLAQGKASPKTVSLLYFLLPLSHAWPLAHQCAMSLLGGGSKINGQWLQDGFLVRDAAEAVHDSAVESCVAEFDVVGAKCFQILHHVVFLFVGNVLEEELRLVPRVASNRVDHAGFRAQGKPGFYEHPPRNVARHGTALLAIAQISLHTTFPPHSIKCSR